LRQRVRKGMTWKDLDGERGYGSDSQGVRQLRGPAEPIGLPKPEIPILAGWSERSVGYLWWLGIRMDSTSLTTGSSPDAKRDASARPLGRTRSGLVSFMGYSIVKERMGRAGRKQHACETDPNLERVVVY